jgi:hypothetical protein
MRAAPYGSCWPSSCAIYGWEVVPRVVVDDYSRYAWVFFLEDKGETFGFVRDLVLRLRNERHRDAIRAICSDNGLEFRNSHFETFCHDLGREHQFSNPYTAPQDGVVERKIEPCVRWLGRCSMSTGLQEGSRLRQSNCMLCFKQDLPQSLQEENLLRVDARSRTQGESIPCHWLQMLYP